MFRKRSTLEVKLYKNQKAYERDARKMTKKSWRVESVTTQQGGRSKKSWLGLGLFNFVRKQKTHYTVTYVR